MEKMNLPAEVAQIADKVSVEKRNEVQSVLNHVFNGVSKMREQLDTVNVVDEKDKVSMKIANQIRLAVRNERLAAERTFDAKRSEVQAAMLSFKTEDSLWLKAKQTMQILTKEIEEQAKWKEDTEKRYLNEQKELKIQQRIVKVQKFKPEIERHEFEAMSDEVFNTFLSGIEKDYNEKIEAEKKAEAERQAEAERIRLQEIENQRLKKEAEEREIQLKKEAEERERIAKIEAEKRAKAEAERQAKAEAERKAQAEKERKEREAYEAKLKAERDEKERIQKELEAKAEAERKAQEAEKERIESELNKGDSDKLKDLVNDLNNLKTKYSFKSAKNKKMYEDVNILIDKVVAHILK